MRSNYGVEPQIPAATPPDQHKSGVGGGNLL